MSSNIDQPTRFVHETLIDLAEGGDPRAPGGAITVALCGHWEHEPPCRWPHHSEMEPEDGGHLVRTVFTVEPGDEAVVRAKIADALAAGEQAGPDGKVSRWTVRPSG
jgi:hypothetical protein